MSHEKSCQTGIFYFFLAALHLVTALIAPSFCLTRSDAGWQCFNSTQGFEDVAVCVHKPMLYPLQWEDIVMCIMAVSILCTFQCFPQCCCTSRWRALTLTCLHERENVFMT